MTLSRAAAGRMPDKNPEADGRSTVPLTAPLDLVAGAAPPSRAPLAPGCFVKHYDILRELGQGGMGSVFLARDTRLARLCAINLLLAYSGEGAERLLSEARATARCEHENIVVTHEVDEIRGYPYMALEYVEGRTLRAWMIERSHDRPLDPARSAEIGPSLALKIMIPIARALACAHETGVAHRDLKPENILLTDAGQVKVVDFGIAKRIKLDEATATIPASPAGGAGDAEEGIGTPPYMSPEQWLRAEVDHQSDLWAAGIILYELCTGSHPLAPAGAVELRDVQDLDVPMPSALAKRPDLGALGALIDRCLKKRKAERIGSARELLSELEPLLSSERSLARAEHESPFAGLSAFQESDAARFFGRDRDAASVIGRLRQQQLVVVAGPSGAGKSSFVRAGVIAALERAEGSWEAFTRGRGAGPSPRSSTSSPRYPRARRTRARPKRPIGTASTPPCGRGLGIWALACARAARGPGAVIASFSSSISSRSSTPSGPTPESGRPSWPALKAWPTTPPRRFAWCSPSARTSSTEWPRTAAS